MVGGIRDGIKAKPLDTTSEQARYRHCLDSVPLGGLVLTRLDRPYLLDFRSHRIWIADYPAGPARPYGMPMGIDGPALSSFLSKNGINWGLMLIVIRRTGVTITEVIWLLTCPLGFDMIWLNCSPFRIVSSN